MSLLDGKPALTVFRSGNKDRTEARKVQDLIDPMSIRTRQVTRPDGTVATHRMHGGLPKVQARSDKETEVPEDPKRGYVANIRSQTVDTLGRVVAFFIKRLSMAWRKQKKAKVFGDYVVSSWVTEGLADVWVAVDAKLNIFTRKSSRRIVPLQGVTTGLPIVISPEPHYAVGSDDATDSHLFLLGQGGVAHRAWRNSGDVLSVYDSVELSAGTSGYPTASFSGVSYSLDSLHVGYAATFFSSVGNVLQRARTLTLGSAAPYAIPGAFVDHVTQAFTFLFPSGTPNTEDTPGVWLNPIAPQDTVFCAMYKKVGGPWPSQGYLNFVGYMVAGTAVDADPSTSYAQVVTYAGNDGYSTSKELGWFGSPLSASVSVTVSADYRSETSTGVMRLVAPSTIAYNAYGSTTEPPTLAHQWLGANHNTTILSGTLAYAASSGTTVKKNWSSTSEARVALLGVDLLYMEFSIVGSSLSETGLKYALNDSLAYQGTTVNFINPADNGFAAQWDGMTFCYEGSSPDQYAPGYLMDQVVVSTSSGVITKTFSGETRDYILFDRENDTYVFLKGEFSGSNSGSSVTLKLVVSRSGTAVEKVLRQSSSGSFSWLMPEELVFNECYYWNPPNPFNGFAPPFCSQGQFKYGAYSEVVDGDDDAFLMSIPLVIQQDPVMDTAPPLSYVFNPMNFRGVMGFAAISLSSPFWSGFGNAKNIINFADGAFHNWVSDVYQEASQDQSTFSEVYRT